jgi:hypothetical protein
MPAWLTFRRFRIFGLKPGEGNGSRSGNDTRLHHGGNRYDVGAIQRMRGLNVSWSRVPIKRNGKVLANGALAPKDRNTGRW